MLENFFGQVLKKLREERGISQENLGHNSGLDRTYISLLERGLRVPTIVTLFKLAKVLDKKPSEIISLLENLNENSD
ncbi:transcriptional regulator with XRE-family HTH domain [Pedobacter cryoconitis]|uniref:Transcriptional regulator with XRE-family HTH domain n=1 Tax=Pedobacter cryoconitis TaxID=188932 RepID=A0A7W8ZNH7_9SPHI|nr:helix-turn-helix transcriptional regulator [Pedobacter cryoconitis]MBB5637272.1 transcriptional regulator with XRE-family HTH domain [Pedobacter cryoconitis]